MRKMLSVTLLMCIVALVSVLLIPTVLATKPTYVSGHLEYLPEILASRLADGNLHLETREEGWWYDDSTPPVQIGHSIDEPCRVVIHKVVFDGDGEIVGWDFRWYTAIATFDTFTVGGKSGGLVMRLVGKSGGPGEEWSGKWVILKGTGGLEGIHGQGTWSGLGWPLGDIPYEGKIHFEPD